MSITEITSLSLVGLAMIACSVGTGYNAPEMKMHPIRFSLFFIGNIILFLAFILLVTIWGGH